MRGCGRSGSRAGATPGRPGCTARRSRSRPASTSTWSAPRATLCSPRPPQRAEQAGASSDAALLRAAGQTLSSGQQVEDRLEVVLADEVRDAMARFGPRELVSPTPDYPVYVDRQRALFSSWYEFFPRSEGARFDETEQRWISGTFDSSLLSARGGRGHGLRRHLPATDPPDRDRLPQGREQHPEPRSDRSRFAVGDRQRRGRPRRHPPRSRRLRRPSTGSWPRPSRSGMEVALDFALQASPDHPWVTEHPEWFSKRADGSIAYAENPPKKYQDIYTSTSTSTGTASTPSPGGSSGCGWTTGCGSSGSTTRTPSR